MWKAAILILSVTSAVWSGVPLERQNLPSTPRQEVPVSGYRLPNNTIPLRYNVELTTHVHDHQSPNQFDFNGKVTIWLRVLEENVQNITLHYRQITVTHVKLTDATNTVLVNDDSSFTTDVTYEFLVILAPSILRIGDYSLELEYHGELRTDNGGFYRSSYTDARGNTRWIATTQFESTDARHAFPCYDEPGTRAPIGLKLTHGNAYHAISNMPIKSSLPWNATYTVTEFEDTLAMQTYLLAFVVSDFAFISNTENKQSVYANPVSISNGDLNFALEAGVKVINALEDYLQVKYSFPKLDQIGIPDFAAGAMENWGLVTYREEVLIYNSTKSPMGQLKRTASIIAHEYGHQFFGNLVSPKWWSYLWLNEGFATLMQYIAADKAYPDLRIQDMATVEALQNAFQSDALENTRPMNSYVETPTAISALFDDIAYDKSGSVLRQLQHAFGDTVFRAGLKYYLDAMQFQPATPADLAAALQRAVDDHQALPSTVNVSDIINSWADQSGYPVLHVRRNTDNVITLSQERYLLKRSKDAVKGTWYLPYNMATSQASDFSSTLPHDWLIDQTVELRPSAALNWTIDDWVIFNKQQTGYYRVNYDDKLWELITHELHHGNHSSIHHLNRAQLIDDSLNLARSGHLKYDITLKLIQYLTKEEEYVPWASLNNGLAYLNRMLAGSSKYNLFKKYVWELVEPSFHKFGLENKPSDTHFAKLTRNILINWACQVGSEDCLTQTNSQLAEVVSNKTKDIDPNLKGVVYCNGLRNADRNTFQYVLDRMHRSQDPSDRMLLISALGCSENTALLEMYLATSLDETGDFGYRGQERSRVFSAVYVNGRVGLETAMKFLDANAATIDRLYNGGSFGGRAIGSAVTGMARRVVNKEQYDDFLAMNTRLESAGYLNAGELSTAKELSGENVQWTNTYFNVIESWLEANVKSGAVRFGTASMMTVTTVAALVAVLL
ncbi:AAEL012783-PA [Aedes aegypti]|uniref:Aminopeptidase n=2 Tax=Aedes aegypti TaxID=7159 RepID=Q16L31_AEDAE|nr:aminopeptidase N [Aedes aegypti]AGT95895.1 aminopeptidase N [Aedes aegypti]EAT35030.1 AAEL012783-PA [Aedes aegypti]